MHPPVAVVDAPAKWRRNPQVACPSCLDDSVDQYDTGQGIRCLQICERIALGALAPTDVGPDSIVEHIARSNGEDSVPVPDSTSFGAETRGSDHQVGTTFYCRDMPFPATGAAAVGQLSTCESAFATKTLACRRRHRHLVRNMDRFGFHQEQRFSRRRIEDCLRQERMRDTASGRVRGKVVCRVDVARSIAKDSCGQRLTVATHTNWNAFHRSRTALQDTCSRKTYPTFSWQYTEDTVLVRPSTLWTCQGWSVNSGTRYP